MVNRLLFCFLLLGQAFCFAQAPSYDELEKALQMPESVTHLKVEIRDKTVADQLKTNIARFTNIEVLCLSGPLSEKDLDLILEALAVQNKFKHLELDGNGINGNVKKAKHLSKLETLVIKNNPGVNYEQLIYSLKDAQHLKILELESNAIKEIPASIAKISSLSKLRLSGNPDLDVDKSAEHLRHCLYLKELILSSNDISKVPAAVMALPGLQTLDLSDNSITEIPVISGNRFIELKINGNLLVNHIDELQKLKGLPLKYLAVDDDLPPGEKESLQQLFPGAKIDFIGISNKTQKVESDSVMEAVASEAGQSSTGQVVNGEIKIARNFKVMSQAYLQYPLLFGAGQVVVDSTIFEERFADTTYVNVWKIQNRIAHARFKLRRDKEANHGIRQEKWFQFDKSSFMRENPEMVAFSAGYWIYSGPLSKKGFRKKYIHGRYYTDVRITYNDAAKNFSITLKDPHGFYTFDAIFRISRHTPLEQSQKYYLHTYERYSRALARRAKRFQQKLTLTMERARKINTVNEEKAWLQLTFMMSEKEKRLTREEWLNYYNQVVADEKVALEHAQANLSNFIRSLQCTKYCPLGNGRAAMSSPLFKGASVAVVFTDANNKTLAARRVFLVDRIKKRYKEFDGSLGSSFMFLPLIGCEDTFILIECVDGNLAYVKASDLDKIRFKPGKDYSLQASATDVNLNTVGDLRSALQIN